MQRYLGIFAGVLYGTIYSGASLAMAVFHPFQVAFGRAFFGFLIVAGAIVFQRKRLLLPNSDRPLLIVLALSGMAAYWISINVGVQMGTALQTALLANTFPLAVILFTPLLLKERPRPLEWVGVILGVTGAALVISDGNFISLQASKTTQDLIGGLITLVGTAAFGFGLTLSRRFVMQRDPVQMAANQLLWAAIIMFPLIFVGGANTLSVLQAGPTGTVLQSSAALLWIGLIATGVAILAVNYGLKATNAMTVAIQMMVSPLVATLLSAFFLREPISLAAIGGGTLIVSAVLVTIVRPETAKPEHASAMSNPEEVS